MLKFDGGKPALRSRIDDHGLRVRPCKDAAGMPPDSVGAWCAVSSELIFRKVHHQVRLRVWHDPLQREWKLILVVVERLDKLSENGRTRFRKGVHAGSLARTILTRALKGNSLKQVDSAH